MEKKIILKLVKNVWFADMVGDNEVLSLFGTTLLPTPFTVETTPSVVERKIRELNPGYSIGFEWPL